MKRFLKHGSEADIITLYSVSICPCVALASSHLLRKPRPLFDVVVNSILMNIDCQLINTLYKPKLL